jgi:hypothetical protein
MCLLAIKYKGRELVTKPFQDFINVSCKLISRHFGNTTMQGAYMLKLGMNVEVYEWKVDMVKRTSMTMNTCEALWRNFYFLSVFRG